MGEPGNEKDRKAVAVPAQLRDAMIVPATRVQLPTSQSSFKLPEQNWIFAQQWMRADANQRGVVELRVGGDDKDFLRAVRQAAQSARGRDVILAVGHGGAGDFRGLTQTVFDALPEEAHGLERHRFAITREVLDLPQIAEKIDGKWVPKRVQLPNGVTATASQSDVDARVPRYEMMVAAGDILRSGGVARLVILACNMAKDKVGAGGKRFHERLAEILGVGVVVFGGLVAIAEVTFTEPGKPARTKEQIWIAMDENDVEHDRPPSDDPDHPSFSEIPQTARLAAPAPRSPP